MPNPSLGVDNDFYYDFNSSDVYTKVSGVWTRISNIRGTTGSTGPQGRPGATVNNYTNIGSVSNLNYNGNNIGNVTLTAPANGTVHITLTGYAQIYNNNTCLFGIGSNQLLTDLDVMVVGVPTSGSTPQQTMYSIISQAVVPVTAGNTYTYFATAFRWQFNDEAPMSLNSVKMTAEFSEK